MPSADIQARQRDGVLRTAISDGMVALLKEFYGVGPNSALVGVVTRVWVVGVAG